MNRIIKSFAALFFSAALLLLSSCSAPKYENHHITGETGISQSEKKNNYSEKTQSEIEKIVEIAHSNNLISV